MAERSSKRISARSGRASKSRLLIVVATANLASEGQSAMLIELFQEPAAVCKASALNRAEPQCKKRAWSQGGGLEAQAHKLTRSTKTSQKPESSEGYCEVVVITNIYRFLRVRVLRLL